MRSLIALSVVVLAGGCGDDSAPADGGIDAPSDDVGLPPGPAGQVLSVPESGQVSVPGLEAPAYVLYVEAGIPHIYAGSEHDLRLVQGFVTARDRFFFFDAARRLGLGRLSELLGDAGLRSDQLSRGQGMTAVADRLCGQLTAEQNATLDAFTSGVNAYIEAVRGGRATPPSELSILAPVLGARRPVDLMEPADRRDVCGFAAVVAYQQGFSTLDSLRGEIAAALPDLFTGAAGEALRRAGVERDIFERVRPITSITSTPGFGLEIGDRARMALRGPDVRPDFRPAALRLPRSMMERLHERAERIEQILRGGRSGDAGSNVWAVAGTGTTDGASLLAGDGHLPLGVPSIFYQLGLDTTVFGEGGFRQVGMTFPGIPYMGPGTNGRVAWSITYFDGDVTDWYVEELDLDAAGLPSSSLFRGEQRPLVRVDESFVIEDVPALGSVGRTEGWPRFETFDGRRIASIEGRTAAPGDPLGPGESLVNVLGDYVVPGDTDGDGVVSAVSFDFAGFDAANTLLAIDGFGRAEDVRAFREETRRLVGFAQNVMAADANGDIFYDGGYSATPCRGYLPRDAAGWAPGADPRKLLDGTEHGAFEVPLGADGRPDESHAEDPARCLIPFEEWPQSLSPDRGYLVNANNDPAGLTLDDSVTNDRYYLGGVFAPGYRAATIDGRLASLTGDARATVAEMQALQADHRTPLGPRFVLFLDDAVDAAAAAGADPRLAALYAMNMAGVDEARRRLDTWTEGGASSASGVETFYETPTAQDREDAVATMIFNAWFRALLQRVFDDEDIDFVFAPDPRFYRMVAITSMFEGRGPGNPSDLASWDPATEESVFFDVLGTPEVETSRECALAALLDALGRLTAAPTAPGVGGFGTADQSQWLWGLRHLVKLESLLATFAPGTMGIEVVASRFAIDTERLPLADAIPRTDPRYDLPWFPRPGSLFAVDAANPPFSGDDYFYGYGPVMRMVIALDDGRVTGANVIPGGQSAIVESPHFTDQAALWLGNDTVPLRFTVDDVVAGATGRETFTP